MFIVLSMLTIKLLLETELLFVFPFSNIVAFYKIFVDDFRSVNEK